jgi:ATP-dependent exoDNAse (exonuclease V) beta subunit
MTKLLLALAALLFVPFLIAKADLWHRKSTKSIRAHDQVIKLWWQNESMPRVLRNARIFLNEEEISTSRPVPLHGRVDQVFQTDDHTLILVDTKTRRFNRVYKSDIIQLSVYRTILKNRYRSQYPVSNQAYVRVVVQSGNQKKVYYRQVTLLTEDEVVDLWRRYTAIKTGRKRPTCTCNGHLHRHFK